MVGWVPKIGRCPCSEKRRRWGGEWAWQSAEGGEMEWVPRIGSSGREG